MKGASRAVSAGAVVRGATWALAAGLMWGLAFIGPEILVGYSPVEITAARFVAYGFVSAVMLLAAIARGLVAGIGERAIWRQAFRLSLVGNLVYFGLLTLGVQHAGAPVAALVIGLLPVLIPVVAGWGDGSVDLRRLTLPALLMLLGLVAVHQGQHAWLAPGQVGAYWAGVGLIVAALASWTWYGVANARAVAARPDIDAGTWASLQGVSLLPLSLALLGFASAEGATAATARPDHTILITVSLMLGFATSWLAMWCWNKAAGLLPAHVAGQFIVFETLAALLYAYLWRGAWPPVAVSIGAALLIVGVLLGVRRLSTPRHA